eukprot:gene24902-18404_t
MEWFDGALAVITGGGDGIGLELALQLVQAGCSVALCDIDDAKLDAAKELCVRKASEHSSSTTATPTVSTQQCDVSDEGQLRDFARHVEEEHAPRGRLNVAVFANAGSMIADARQSWDR